LQKIEVDHALFFIFLLKGPRKLETHRVVSENLLYPDAFREESRGRYPTPHPVQNAFKQKKFATADPSPPLFSPPLPYLSVSSPPLRSRTPYIQLGGLGSAVSSHSGVWGGAPAEIEFAAFWP